MSFFEKVELLPPDPILSMPIIFASDSREKKVNLGIGTYRDEKGLPLVFSAIKKAEEIIHAQRLNKEYLPIEGHASYLKETMKLIYGDEFPADRMGILQTIGGTNALRLGADFFRKHNLLNIYISDPSWPNHRPIFEKAGMSAQIYPYYDYQNANIKFDEMCNSIKKMPAESVILLHACCHNPTGLDLTQEQWKKLSELIKKQRVIPFFDLAYQGFGTSLEEDAWPVRYFLRQGHEMLVASSYSKNFGLYGERVGSLSWVVHSKEIAAKMLSQFKSIIRGIYSSPPLHGARLIATVLESQALKEEWARELSQISKRIVDMRLKLMQRLNSKNIQQNFDFMNHQKGMFSLSGLNAEHIDRLKNEFAIYLLNNGRMSIPGLTMDNVDYVADSMAKVLKT